MAKEKSTWEWVELVKRGTSKVDDVPERIRKVVERLADKTPLWSIDPWTKSPPGGRMKPQPIRECKQ